MRSTSKKKLFGLAVGSLFAACSVFGPVATAHADGNGPGVPAPQPPKIPTDPSEGLPIPLPGGGG